MTIRFLLICEGASDTALTQHIRILLIHLGHADPEGTSWSRGRQLVDKIQLGLEHSGDCDLLLVHRDADANHNTRRAGPKTRQTEIEKTILATGYSGVWVGIVPVQSTEAWLLLDASAIRRVVGRPHSTNVLSLPYPNQVEHEADPKARLTEALFEASGATGRKLRRLRRDLRQIQRRLLEELPISGELEQVPSWVRFKESLATALASIKKFGDS